MAKTEKSRNKSFFSLRDTEYWNKSLWKVFKSDCLRKAENVMSGYGEEIWGRNTAIFLTNL